MINLLLLMTLMTGLLTISQVLLKKILLQNPTDILSLSSIIALASNFSTYGVILSMGSAFFIWVRVLQGSAFTTVYPLVSISYIWALIAGYYVFDESLTLYNIGGVALIMCGSVLVTMK